MKSRASKLLAALALPALLTTLNSHLSTTFAQGTAFTYQGRLNDGAGPANGNYDLRFTIYDSPSGGLVVGEPITNTATSVSNGLFTVTLDFGLEVFTGPERWLDIAVRTNGSASAPQTLSPRQELTATPYAVTAGNVTGVVPSDSLSGDYPGAVSFDNPINTFSGNGAGLTSLNASQLTTGTVPAAALSNAWEIGGNIGTSPTNGNFVGTIDIQPLEFRAGDMRVLRLEPDTRSNGLSGNLIGGFTNNMIQQPGSGGDFIGSGGFLANPNLVLSNSSGVFIGAGSANQIGPNVNDAFIGTGFGNSIGGDGFRSVIGGGENNTNDESDSVIGGGQNNFVQPSADHSFIGGGQNNTIFGSPGSVFDVIVGGDNNTIQTNVSFSFIAGGYGNTIQTNGYLDSIGGGDFNIIQSNASYATIAGGIENTIGPNTFYTTMGGGGFSTNNSPYATISGGANNSIGTNSNSGTISGGFENIVKDNTFDSHIGGGSFNTIGMNSYYSTIAGGRENSIGDNSTACAVGGGFDNNAYAPYATVPGGYANFADGAYSLAAGTEAFAFNSGSFVWADNSDFNGFASTTTNQFSVRALGGVRFVTGGAGITVDGQIVTPLKTVNDANHSNIVNVVEGSSANTVSPGVYGATISGGGAVNYDGTDAPNTVTADFGTVSGGLFNQSTGPQATIGGGSNNIASGQAAIVGGGANNNASGNYSTVPGGYQNQAAGIYSLAAGNEAEATNDGTFVWADSQNAPFASTSTNQFLIRASGGVGINTNSPAGAALNVVGTVRATAFQGDGSGLINVSSGALGNYIFGINSTIQAVTTANVFQDVTFATDAQLNGWMHTAGTSQYTNAQAGLYLIQYFGQIESTLANGTNAQMHATLNGVEIGGSRAVVTFPALEVVTVSKSIIAGVNAADILTVQFTGSGTGVRLTGTGNATLTVTRIQ